MKIHSERDSKVQLLVVFQDEVKSIWIEAVWIVLLMNHGKIYTTAFLI